MKILKVVLLLTLYNLPSHSGSFDLFDKQCECSITYRNRNQIDPPPLTINNVKGRVVSDIYPVPKACVGLFTENEQLIASTLTDKNGLFKFSQIIPGEYRLLVEYESLCTANVQIQVVKKAKNSRVVFHMLHYGYSGSEGCSYADYK